MDNLEEDLTCSVCYSLFTDPRVLPCSHTFCKPCLDSVLQISNNFSIWRPLRLPLKCPNCRSVVELPPNGVDALPVNVCLRAIIEKYQRDGQPRAPSCPEHPRQPLNVYCVQDCELICGLCLTIGRHQGHAIDDLQTAYLKACDAPAGLVERLTDRRWDDLCDLAEKLEREKSQYEELIRQDRETVEQFFQGVEDILARKKEAFMKVLDTANGQLASTYKPLMEKLKEVKEEQLELISLISVVGEEESPLAFLEKIDQLRERVDALSQVKLPQVPSLHISPRAEDFLEGHWTNVTVGNLAEAPIPKISCSIQRPSTKEPQPTWNLQPVVFLVLLLLLSLFCLKVGGASFGFGVSNLSQISRGLSRLADDLSLQFHRSWLFLQCSCQDLSLKISSYIYALGESTRQHVDFFFKTLHLR